MVTGKQQVFRYKRQKDTRIASSFKNVLKIKFLLMKGAIFEHNLKALNNNINTKFDL